MTVESGGMGDEKREERQRELGLGNIHTRTYIRIGRGGAEIWRPSFFFSFSKKYLFLSF